MMIVGDCKGLTISFNFYLCTIVCVVEVKHSRIKKRKKRKKPEIVLLFFHDEYILSSIFIITFESLKENENIQKS